MCLPELGSRGSFLQVRAIFSTLYEPAHKILALVTSRAAKAQTSLRIYTVSSEFLLLTYRRYGRRGRLKSKIRSLALLDTSETEAPSLTVLCP